VTDIVKRLRDPEQGLTSSDRFHLHKDAADELERLQTMLQELTRMPQISPDTYVQVRKSDIDDQNAENERLRKELSYRVHTDEDIKVQNNEIERLRAALEKITETHDVQTMLTHARAALEGK
jgi:hypothetical protein